MKKGLLVLGFIVSLLGADVTIKSASYQEVKNAKGAIWVKTSKVIPGTKIKYVNTINNDTQSVATNLVATNAIPAHMTYVDGSATCNSNCKVTFSVDNGKSFDVPNNLFVTKNGKKRAASGSDYTTIRWVLGSLASKKQDELSYEAVLK